MPVGRLIRHIRIKKYEWNTKMRLRQRDVEIAAKCVGVNFSLTGDDAAEFFEEVESFKYLVCVLHRTDG